MAALSHDLAIGEFRVPGLGEAAVPERSEKDNSSRSPAARITSFTFRLRCVMSGRSGWGHVAQGPRLPQSRTNIRPPMRSLLMASSSAISSGYSATPFASNRGNHLFSSVFAMQDVTGRPLLLAVV